MRATSDLCFMLHARGLIKSPRKAPRIRTPVAGKQGLHRGRGDRDTLASTPPGESLPGAVAEFAVEA